MQKKINGTQKIWQVGITARAKQALEQLASENKRKGFPASQGLIASTLILRAFEHGEFGPICKEERVFLGRKRNRKGLFLIVYQRQQKVEKFFADKAVHAPKHRNTLVNFICSKQLFLICCKENAYTSGNR